MNLFAKALFSALLLCAALAACAGSTPDVQPEEQRAQLDEREILLEGREAALAQREEELARRGEELARRGEELEVLAESIDAQRSAIREQEEALSERERALSGQNADAANPSTDPLFNPGVEYTPEQEAAALLERQREQWFEGLDYDLVGGVFWEDDLQGYCIQVLDVAAFEASDAMRQGQELGISIRLLACKHSWNELTGAVDKLFDAMARFQISAMGPDAHENRIFVDTMDVSEKNKQAIRDYCGLSDIEFTEADAMTNPGT